MNRYNVKTKNELEIIQSGDNFIFKFTNKALKHIKRGVTFQKNIAKDGKNSVMTFIHHDAYVNKVMPVVLQQQKKEMEKASKESTKIAENIKGDDENKSNENSDS